MINGLDMCILCGVAMKDHSPSMGCEGNCGVKKIRGPSEVINDSTDEKPIYDGIVMYDYSYC